MRRLSPQPFERHKDSAEVGDPSDSPVARPGPASARRGQILAGYAPGALVAAGIAVLALRGGTFDGVTRGESFAVVWWAVGLAALLAGVPRHRSATGVRVALAALVLLALWMAIALTWTASKGRTTDEIARTVGFAGVVLLCMWTFTGRDAGRAIGAVTVALVGVCGLAMLSRLAPDIATTTLKSVGFDPERLSYPFQYWNAVGCWASMTAALALALSAHAGRAWTRGLALAAVCLAASTAYLTYSRTTVATMAIGVLAVLVL